MKFEVDDEEYMPNKVPPIIEKILSIVQSLPDGKLYTTERLAVKVGYSRDTVANYVNHPALAEYKILTKGRGLRRNLFGNTNTIQAYRQEFEE